MHMRLMLLGGGSALGRALIRLGAEEDISFLAPRPPDEGWTADALDQVLAENHPDVVINLAYYFDWFQAGQLNERRLLAQVYAVERLANLCQRHDMILLHPSSYRVFDGNRTVAYAETDAVAPLDVRGQVLWANEQHVRTCCERHVILRLGWLLDDSQDGLLGRFLQRLEQSGEIHLADDRRGNPTTVEDVSRVLLAILKQLDCEAALWGTYHYGAHEPTTPMVVAQTVLAEAEHYIRPRLDGLLSQAHAVCDDADTEPQHGVLACKKIFNTFGIKPRSWRSGMPALLERYYRRLLSARERDASLGE